jgi:hypothetical protein
VPNELTLDILTLGRIFAGMITKWNDPMIKRTNPGYTLPNVTIEVILQQEPRSFIDAFTKVAGQNDPVFAAAIPASLLPVWPTAKYAKHRTLHGMDGPSSWVLDHPYSISIALVSVAEKLGASPVKMMNYHGSKVSPTYLTIAAAMNERIVQSSIAASGGGRPAFDYNYFLSLSHGPLAWPFVVPVTLVVPRSYAYGTCVGRSELVKFVRWLLKSSLVRDTLCTSESASMQSAEVDLELHADEQLTSLQCENAVISTGAVKPITVGGSSLSSTHTGVRQLFLESYSSVDQLAEYIFAEMDEGEAMEEMIKTNSHHATDALWFMPMTFEKLYPQQKAAFVDTGKVQQLHLALFGVVIQHNLPAGVKTLLTPTAATSTGHAFPGGFPLQMDMELLGLIFTGEVTSWLDQRMLQWNPQLFQAFNQTRESSHITLVLCGRGRKEETPRMGIGNHLVMALSETEAFQPAKSGLPPATLPVDWTALTTKLTAAGVRYIWADSEIQMESSIASTQGAIGYVINFSNASNPMTDFSLVKYVDTPTNGTQAVSIAPTTDSYLALAAGSLPTSDPSFAPLAARSRAPEFAQGYPIPMLISVALPTDLSTDASSTIDKESLCFRQTRAVHFASWVASSPLVLEPSLRSGRGALSRLPAWREYFIQTLRLCTCQKQPVTWAVPAIWSLPSSVQAFGRAVSAIGLGGVAFFAVLLFLYHSRTMVRAANVTLQVMQLCGIVGLLAGAIIWTLPVTTGGCATLAWMVVVGFAATFGPLCIKILKVYLTHASKKTYKSTSRHLSNRKMRLLAGAWIAVHVALMAVAQSDGGLLTPQTVILEESSREHHYLQCLPESKTSAIVIAIGALNAAQLLITMLFTLTIRHVSSAFNDSKHISYVIHSTVLSTVIIVPLLIFTGGLQSDVGAFLVEFLILWIALGALFLTFGFKFSALLVEEFQAARTARSQSSTASSTHNTSQLTTTGVSDFLSNGFGLASIERVGLATLEKYLTALETQLRLAKAKRKLLFGSEFVSSEHPSMAPSKADRTPYGTPGEIAHGRKVVVSGGKQNSHKRAESPVGSPQQATRFNNHASNGLSMRAKEARIVQKPQPHLPHPHASTPTEQTAPPSPRAYSPTMPSSHTVEGSIVQKVLVESYDHPPSAQAEGQTDLLLPPRSVSPSHDRSAPRSPSPLSSARVPLQSRNSGGGPVAIGGARESHRQPIRIRKDRTMPSRMSFGSGSSPTSPTGTAATLS